MGLTFEVLSGDRMASLESEWDVLVAGSASPTVFKTWAWQATALRHLPANAEARIIVVREGGDLMALAPLARWNGLPSTLRFLVAGTAADHLDFIVRAGAETRVAGALREGLAVAARDADSIDLDSCAEISVARNVLAEIGSFRTPVQALVDTCPYVDLQAGFDGYLQSRFDKKRRYNLTRDTKRAFGHFGLVHEVVTRREDLEARMQELFELHGARRHARGLTSAFLTDRSRAFHLDLSAALFERGCLSLQFMRLDGKAQSALYAFEYARRFYYFQSGITPQGEDMSAGSVLIALAMQQASAERAVVEFDFLRGDEGYKARWQTGVHTNYSWRSYRQSLRGGMLAAFHQGKARARALKARVMPSRESA